MYRCDIDFVVWSQCNLFRRFSDDSWIDVPKSDLIIRTNVRHEDDCFERTKFSFVFLKLGLVEEQLVSLIKRLENELLPAKNWVFKEANVPANVSLWSWFIAAWSLCVLFTRFSDENWIDDIIRTTVLGYTSWEWLFWKNQLKIWFFKTRTQTYNDYLA